MARRIVSVTSQTPTATADAATPLANGTYPFVIQGGSTTQLNKLWEVSISGLAASSSSPTFMMLGRDSTIAVTLGATTTFDASLDPATVALAAAPITGNTFTTAPQRSTTLHLANCGLNAFGGVYFWRANRLEECITILGNTASFGEVSLSAFTGGTPGAIGAHAIYEPL